MVQTLVIDDSRTALCLFGIVTTISSEVFNTAFPVGKLWMSFHIHIVDADTPILLSINHMNQLRFFCKSWTIFRFFATLGRLPELLALTFILMYNVIRKSRPTLRSLMVKRLHRRFGHRHIENLVNVLKKSEVSRIMQKTQKMLDRIGRSCAAYQEYVIILDGSSYRSRQCRVQS